MIGRNDSVKGSNLKRVITRGGLYLGLILCLTLGMSMESFAASIAGEGAFYGNLTWEKILEETVQTKSGVVQSICATEDYIICLENSGDTSKENDIAYAYYKNDVDPDGNPVEQYSLAFINDSFDWEHCNGMCYNPDKREIYVALYTNNTKENKGCVYVMDPDTLDYKGKLKLIDDSNILGIGYDKKHGRYVIQTNADESYSIKILDGDFVLQKSFDAVDLGLGSNSQDMCVCGNYVINFPLTFDKEGQGSYMNVYSIEGETVEDLALPLVKAVPMDIEAKGTTKVEPESICEVEDGVFIATVNIMDNNKKRKFAWYKIELPYYYEVTTECVGGTITESKSDILKGSDYKVSYKPEIGKELLSVMVDGEYVDIDAYPIEFQFNPILADHEVKVEFVNPEKSQGGFLSGLSGPDESTTGDKGGKFKIDSSMLKKAAKIVIPIVILLALLIGMNNYRKYLAKERRKRQLRSKLRREKEKQMLRQAMKDMEGISENVSLEELLRDIQEYEMQGKTTELKQGKTTKLKKRRR